VDELAVAVVERLGAKLTLALDCFRQRLLYFGDHLFAV
jgi:hypothetical protein